MTRLLKELFKRQKLVILLYAIILGYGLYSYFVIPKQDMPNIDTPYMVLSITSPSMSASNIEEQIVDDVEKVILTFKDVTEVRSTVYDNYAVIITTFSFATESPTSLSKEIYDKINELSLSNNITDISYQSEYNFPHIIFAVNSSTLSEIELLHQAESFKNSLLLIDEINEVKIDNAVQKEVVITLDQSALELIGLNMLDVYQIIYANTANIPLGSIATLEGNITLSGDLSIDDISQLEDLILIPFMEGITPQITLNDVSTITLENTSYKSYEFNGNNTVFLSVYFESDIDFTTLGTVVLDNRDDFLDTTNIPNLSIDQMLFLPDYVETQINDVFMSLLLAIIIVMIIVLIGIGIRNSLLIVITIPIILFATVGTLYLFGFELHKLTIVGLIISIGILVDNQIVITEGIKRNIDDGIPKIDAAKKAIRDNLWPVMSSTLTTIAAFIVIVLLPGFLGEITSSMPLTVIITISFSFVLSMTLSPILAVLFLKQNKASKATSIHELRIKKMIKNTIKYPAIWLVGSIIILGLSIFVTIKTQQIDLYPNDERAVIYIDFESSIATPEYTVYDIKSDISTILNQNDNLLIEASSIGGDLPRFHFSTKFINELPNVGRIYATFDMNEDQLLAYKEDLEQACSSLNANITVNTLELSPPIAPLRVFIEGDNIDSLNSTSAAIYEEINEQDYIKTSAITSNIKSNKYFINYDTQAMSLAHITKIEIDSMIAIYVNGLDLEIFHYNDQLINVNLNSTIADYNQLLTLPITSSVTSTTFPLGDFITITEQDDYVVLNRLNNNNVTIIDIYPNDIDTFDLEANIKTIVSTHELGDIKVSYGGENQMFEEISGDLIRASIIAIVLIFIIMFIQFNNFVKPLIVFATIPLSFTGSFIFLILFHSPITATSLIGMVSLLGVTVNTGILLVENISKSHTSNSDLKEACVNAVYLRFRPIMLTSITTILGLIPLLITGGNFFRPLAITFMGGLVTSTLITIFLVPSIYFMIYNKKASSH